MKKVLVFFAFVLSAALVWEAAGQQSQLRTRRSRPGSRQAEAAAKPTAVPASGEAPAFNWDQAPVELVLQAYCERLNKTVLIDPQTPKPTITLKSREGQKLTDKEYLDAIETVLEMNGIHLEPYKDSFIRALPRKDVRKEGIPLIMDAEQSLSESGRVVSMMIPFKNISAEEAQKTLEGLKSNSGVLLVFERTNSILVTDTEQNINRMLEVIRVVDVAIPVTENVYVRQVQYASAQEIQAALQKIVEESQKELEKSGGKQVNTPAQQPPRQFGRGLLGRGKEQAAAPVVNNESLVMSVSDADRGTIRGKVLILADERSNKLIIVTSKANMDFFDRVIEALDEETTPDTVVKVYRLKYAESEDVSDMINDLIGNAPSSKGSSKNSQNQNSKNASKGANLTRNQPATAQKKSANQRTGEAKAGELSKENTTVLSDKRINGIVVMTQKELVPVVESIIEAMDVKLSQVLIETMILQVQLGDEISTGIDWVNRHWNEGHRHESQLGGGGGSSVGTLSELNGGSSSEKTFSDWASEAKSVLKSEGTLSSESISTDDINAYIQAAKDYAGGNNVSPAGAGITYFLKSEKLNLSAILKAAKSDSRAKYVASPIVMTVDNKEATIEATQMRYLLKGYTYSGNTYSGSAVPDYEQKEIGLTVKVTPKINPNGTVMLTVEEEFSQIGANQEIESGGGGSGVTKVTVPTTVTRKMSADVLLDNRQTVVLGGLTETSVSSTETGIPILKDIPWIGRYLFGSTTDSESRSELLVFMTPYVLADGSEAEAEALRRKKTLSDQRAWEDHGWSASNLADPVAIKERLRRQKEEWKKMDEDYSAAKELDKAKLDRALQLKERALDDQARDAKSAEEIVEKLNDLEKRRAEARAEGELKAREENAEMLEQLKAEAK